MRKLMASGYSKGFFIYDNLLHGRKLAGHSGVLAADCWRDITHSNETPCSAFRHGVVTDYLHPAAGGNYRLSFLRRIASWKTARRARARHVALYRQMANGPEKLQAYLCARK